MYLIVYRETKISIYNTFYRLSHRYTTQVENKNKENIQKTNYYQLTEKLIDDIS